MKKCCRNCRYIGESISGGICRYNPPTIISGYVENIVDYAITGWPDVNLEYDWCGKFKPMPTITEGCVCVQDEPAGYDVEYCGARFPITGHICTRPAGHEGHHVSCSEKQHKLARWSND